MLGLLQQYLIHNHKVVLPGLGAVVVHRDPAVSEFTEHSFTSPAYSYRWDQTITNPAPGFFRWLAGKLNMTEEDAAMVITNFASALRREVNAGKEVEWEGVGVIRRASDNGAIELQPINNGFVFDGKVHGEKVIHEDASHTILVGDEEKLSTEMTEILHIHEKRKFTWFHAALIIAAAALIFIVIYLSMNGWTPGSVSNKNKISPKEAPASYK
ncbi:MAG: hypothetical protein QM764_01520 [Chitinophagaceae bacterium]